MITKFKIFESVGIPKVGDWILMRNWWAGQHIHQFIDTTPAQITNITINSDKYTYTVKFDKPFLTDADLLHPDTKFRDVFENGKEFSVGGFNSWNDFVVYHSDNKEDVEVFINSHKYNL